jgi:hypothetical protein
LALLLAVQARGGPNELVRALGALVRTAKGDLGKLKR